MQEERGYGGFYWIWVTGFILTLIAYLAESRQDNPLISPFIGVLAAGIGIGSIVVAFRHGDRLRGFATVILVMALGFLANAVTADQSVGMAIVFGGVLALTGAATALLAVKEFLRQSHERDDHVRSMQDVHDAAAARDG